MGGNINISIIIINFNTFEYTSDCIKSIFSTCFENIPQVIIVDNASTDGSQEKLKKLFPECEFLELDKNYGYSFAINRGFHLVKHDYIIVTNSDVVFLNNSIQNLQKLLERNEKYGVVGPQQIFNDGSWQRSYGRFNTTKNVILKFFLLDSLKHLINKYKFTTNKSKPESVDYIDGAVMCFRKSLFIELNGFDEDFFFYSEEVDFCKRAKDMGYMNYFFPEVKVIHHRGGSQENQGANKASIKQLVSNEIKLIEKHNICNKKFFLTLMEFRFRISHIIKKLLGKKKVLDKIYYTMYKNLNEQ